MLKSKRVPFRLKRKLVSETYNEILLALTFSGRLACTAYHEKLSIFRVTHLALHDLKNVLCGK